MKRVASVGWTVAMGVVGAGAPARGAEGPVPKSSDAPEGHDLTTLYLTTRQG